MIKLPQRVQFSVKSYLTTVTLGFLLGLLVLVTIRTQQISEAHGISPPMTPILLAVEEIVGGALLWILIYLLAVLLYFPIAGLIVMFANRSGAVSVTYAAVAGVISYLPWTALLAYTCIERDVGWFSTRVATTVGMGICAGAVCGVTYYKLSNPRSLMDTHS